MTLDEAIKHAEEVAKEKEKKAKIWLNGGNEKIGNLCVSCADEHRQLAEWLKDYKRLKEQELRWIPCSERLPEENITVIGTTKFDDIYKAELYDDCGKKKWYADADFDVPIVAWMPLAIYRK